MPSIILSQVVAMAATASEYHVATTGNDANPGRQAHPLKTISAAANLAQPGDTITVHAGIYREQVIPPRGGTSEQLRIVYQAAPGESVTITGSEPVTGWKHVTNEAWQVVLPNSFFGKFNPYLDLIRGDWFTPKGREHHSGAVYLNGEWLTEAAKLDETLEPATSNALWFASVDGTNTTIWAQFPGVNPNDAQVEINVRQTVFTPEKIGLNYITVRGFNLRNAATPWAPPTAGQIGLITAYWCKGWIIENNDIAYSACSGVSLGKYKDEFDNTSADSAMGYVKTIERAQAHTLPWTKENIGHHVVRNNHISHCEQTGVVGSLGCSFSTITENIIHDIHVRQLFAGAEMAGIKLHGAIDTVISHNHIYRTNRGLWLDWMAQGTRVSANLFHDNDLDQDLFMEVNHGPYLVDNNLFLSRRNLLDVSEGGAFVHNLFVGKINSSTDSRKTPFHTAHSTTLAGVTNFASYDNRFFNNIFVGQGGPNPAYDLRGYEPRRTLPQAGGNVYYDGAQPCKSEHDPLVLTNNPSLKLELKDGQFLLHCHFGPELGQLGTGLVTSALLGKAKTPDLPYENSDGSPLVIDHDYFGKPRSATNPAPGPFETPGTGPLSLWTFEAKGP